MTVEITSKIEATPEGIVEFLLDCPFRTILEIQTLMAKKGAALSLSTAEYVSVSDPTADY